MTTKEDVIKQLKKENPVVRLGDDEQGYTELTPADYEATIETWADNLLAAEAKALKAETDKAALLSKLGITADEAKLLLS
jgi:hypothetical protein